MRTVGKIFPEVVPESAVEPDAQTVPDVVPEPAPPKPEKEKPGKASAEKKDCVIR